MTKTRLWWGLLLVLMLANQSLAQTAESAQESEVRSLVSFYRYMLNTVGAARTSTRDKEVIITESYKKAFLNDQVQIEDDLLPDRQVITNKDVSAYLRDVDFFFQDITFSFEEITVTEDTRENGDTYYLVSFLNTIDATTLEGEPYQSTKKRFLEVNIDEQSGDLKIASVYTTKVSRERELREWWNTLSFGWRSIFSTYVTHDSLTDEVLLQMGSIDSLSLAGNQMIQSLEPVMALTNLKVLDLSDSKISDLEPLRYARNLRKLKAANTAVADLSVLEYFEKLEYLDLRQTLVRDIRPIEKLSALQHLNLSGTNVAVFEPLDALDQLLWLDLSNTAFANPELIADCKPLQYLNVAKTGITALRALRDLHELKELNASETYIHGLHGLANLQNLQLLHVNQTRVNSLEPVAELRGLRRIYADYTGVSEQAASDFMAQRPGVVVVTNSEKIMEWWQSLTGDWREALQPYMGGVEPSKESVIKLLNLDSLDISGMQLVSSEPLRKFKKLRYLNVSNNLFTHFRFTREMELLETLVARKLAVETTSGLAHNKQLKTLVLTGSITTSIQALHALNKLELLDLEQTEVTDEQVRQYLFVNPKTVVIYQSDELLGWWNNLSPTWQDALAPEELDAYHLHELVQRTELTIDAQPVLELFPLDAFVNLQQLTLNRTRVTDLSALQSHDQLRTLTCTNGPLMTLEGIGDLRNLEALNIANTAVDDLRPLDGLSKLKKLNASGTNIKKLKGLTELRNLESLDISNTRVWRLDRLYDIRNLKTLVCYNTRIRAHKLDEFKSEFPDCEITFY
ncbi:leucine-rich repeat domain-containing protein [Marinoscillum furvescens]|uniref:Leucine-rich repeat (LRR) protein n=1 Tax=Marinoscillum furvescens DSM 4134 TaxID=1122208 RepID=A0A3D9KX87_MARFU|nr:leucine-rich repeat domain-containing protein [Marinoscillum furvescens]RED92064.1 Leucine-rich repeat (LRR) protein [Marinoscillum furvescens DSM 4134]